tara:strand:- start:3913 stop:4422 length:510 start_codon:yes stop_codon:yes gene_type:complete
MDEVSLLIDLLDSNWSSSATTLQSAGTITSDHIGKPNIIDIRNLDVNRGSRYDLSLKDLIVIFEDSQTIEYPTVHFDIRNENYSFTLHIRTVQDERAGTDGDFGKDRLRALYLITRHVLEGKRTGYTASDGSKFNQIFVGSRNESNDRKKRIFGYKISIEAKRFALSVP